MMRIDRLNYNVFLKLLIKKGFKSKGCRILFECFSKLKATHNINPELIFHVAIYNVSPFVKVCSSSSFSTFAVLPFKKQVLQGMRWIILGAFKNKKNTFCESLAHELWQAYNKKGYAYTKSLSSLNFSLNKTKN